MPQATYSDAFKCIGSDCEDTCCQGWTVPIDRSTWDKYQSLPTSPLSEKIRASLIRKSESRQESTFAILRMSDANECPLLTPERLCGIQSQLGEGLLSHACATFPRYIHNAAGIEETALTLSCPEAARLVLLTPNLETLVAAPLQPATDQPHFWPLRRIILGLIRNRAYPLWQRLFLLDHLCRRLDVQPDAAFLASFESALTAGSLVASLNQLPYNHSAQLDIALRLAGLLLHRSNLRPRFVECIAAFTAGLGNGPGATLATLTTSYTRAQQLHFRPFFSLRPHILENFLINTVLRCQFPFGKQVLDSGTPPNHTREFANLAAQFVLIRGLLIGVAGHHGANFSVAHVVHTVQSASKHFEHHPEFLNLAHALLVEAHMDDPRGIAILLRDQAEIAATVEAAIPEAHPAARAANRASAQTRAPATPS